MNKNPSFLPLVDHVSPDDSVSQIAMFREYVQLQKSRAPHPPFGWYPYDTLSSWWVLSALLSADFATLQKAIKHRPVLDIGCGDGDLAFFLSYLGCKVTVVDYPRSNFNSMQGVKWLKERLQSDIQILEIDLDGEAPFSFPEDDYGLVLLLGILYHLKNPFAILEKLARRARYCALSTRIAANTPLGVPMRDEALAYLLDSGEANNDSTNFWIFSQSGLARLLKRSGWEIRGSSTHGCQSGSNPSSNEADERMFLFLRSKVRSMPATVELSKGWWPTEGREWCWVDKAFEIALHLTEEESPSELELCFVIHHPTAASTSTVGFSCSANGAPLGEMIYTGMGERRYKAAIPASVATSRSIILSFVVKHSFDFVGEVRDLGVIIPCRGDVVGHNSLIGLWIG